MPLPIEIVLFLFLLSTAIAIACLEDLFAAAMLTGIFSLLSAGLFTIMDAVDVAFTEAAVGAGVATVFILCTLSLTAKREYQQPTKVLPFIVVGITGAALIYGTLDMPAYGDPDAVTHRHLSAKFIEIEERAMFSQNEHAVESARHGNEEKAVGLPNIVTSILASYRGYDTFGEVTVIFTATIGVMLLLRGRRHKKSFTSQSRSDGNDVVKEQPMRMREKIILRVVSKAFIPFIFMFALYVQFHGDFGPGGGFQAGVIFAAGIILYGVIFGLDTMRSAVPERVLVYGIISGLILYGGVGIVSLLSGANFLDYDILDTHNPAHGQHLGILLVELGVGITVTCAMTTIFYGLAGRGKQ